MQQMVTTRIAPSPTGFPHIGTVYQSLFDYAFVKKHDGRFLVRIEDTDQSRLVEGAEETIFAMLDWFGLQEDESPRKEGKFGPYRQSERLDIYADHAQQLVEKGHAYYCFCSKDRLDELRQQQTAAKTPPKYDKHCLAIPVAEALQRAKSGESHVIRMNVPADKTIVCRDEIRGEVAFQSGDIDDQVLMKSDGFPTYHLAVVVDDHLMEVTHVVRGEEWISSTPKHVLLYQFFGWEAPLFFHTPILRNPDKSKMGKRHGHTAVTWYKENGFLPEALLNFLALMGWSHPEGKEFFTLEEFIAVFDLKDIKAAGPIFDLKKLEWLNGEWIRQLSPDLFTNKIMEFYGDKYMSDFVTKIAPLVQERIKTLVQFADYADFFLAAPQEYEMELTGETETLSKIKSLLESMPQEEWKADKIGAVLQNLAQELGIPFGKFFMLIRVALTGKKNTPPMNESMEILGQAEVVKRLATLQKS